MILAGFSPHGLILTVALGSFIGSLGGFYIGYLYSNDIADLVISQKNRQKHTKRIRHYIDRYGKIITAVIAITPVPYFPVVFGTIKLKPKDFIIYGAVVRSCSYVLYGYLVYFFQINLTQFL